MEGFVLCSSNLVSAAANFRQAYVQSTLGKSIICWGGHGP